MIDNSKEAVNGAVAVKALNTVKVYCVTHFCPECPLREDLEKYNSCPIPKLDVKTGVGFFRDIAGKRTTKPPKFDGSLQLSPEFRAYSAGIIEDDGYIAQIDGSMIAGIDAEDPRVEITVSEITNLKFPLYELHPKLKKKLAEGNLKRLTKTRKKQHEAE